ncbi:MAG: glycosyltransferase, partial [Muribaculaceae bacterium]|nr:glycosyltransferase [Muribaculaceae bacterium]
MSEALVIIPTYNEIENVSNIIDAVMQLPELFDVLIIDDGSPDGTADVVRSKMTEYPGRIH